MAMGIPSNSAFLRSLSESLSKSALLLAVPVVSIERLLLAATASVTWRTLPMLFWAAARVPAITIGISVVWRSAETSDSSCAW